MDEIGFGGGGIKGVLHIGVLEHIAKKHSLLFPKGVWGCSIGSIIATYIAFELPISELPYLAKKYLTPELFHLAEVSNFFESFGLFDVNLLKDIIVEAFNEIGFDIQSKKMNDAKMPLFIVASNIGKNKPTIFKNNVPVLDAILASCCLPGIFKPHELYGQKYIDGHIFTPCLNSLNPNMKVFSLTTYDFHKSSNFLEYPLKIFSQVHYLLYLSQKNHNTIELKYPNLKSNSDLTKFNLELITQSVGQKLVECLD